MKKQFKTYEEQLDILISKGLIVDNDTLKILRKNNYYFLINRYKNVFIEPNVKPNVFKKGTHFNEIVSLYNFDRNLRIILLKYIITIENTLKSIISYEFSKKYDYNYLDINSYDNFNFDEKRVNELKGFFKSINNIIKNSLKHEKHLRYYKENYEDIPLWIVINNLSLGMLISFYSYMKKEDRENVAREFEISSTELYNFLEVLLHFRNYSAHNQRIFDEKSKTVISKNKYHKLLELNNCGYNDIMAVLIVFKYLLTDNDFKQMLYEMNENFNELKLNLKTIELKEICDKMGIDDYKKVIEKL